MMDVMRERLREFRWSSLITPAAVLVITAGVILMPFERSGWDVNAVVRFTVAFLVFVAIFAIFAIGLNIQWGYAGVFNFGVMAFFIVGAYTAAVVTKPPATGEFVGYVGGFGDALDFAPALRTDQWFIHIVGIFAAAGLAGIVAFFVSIPALRLREDYLAIATIGVAELVRRIVIEERWLVNGTRGLPGIPRPLGDLVDPGDWRYVILGISVVVLAIVFFLAERIVRSPWGRVLRALREDELATAASGKSVFSFKSQGFVLGAMIMGVGGAMYAYANSVVSTDDFNHFIATFIFWAMLIVGGAGNNMGAILGAYIVWGFWRITLQLQGYDLPDVLAVRIPYVREIALGTLIVIVLLLRPQGLIPEERRVSIWAERLRRRVPALKRSPGELDPEPREP
jgi:branched-chain amino acid transport system permease protein